MPAKQTSNGQIKDKKASKHDAIFLVFFTISSLSRYLLYSRSRELYLNDSSLISIVSQKSKIILLISVKPDPFIDITNS